jgi:hypothetical protein
MHATVDEFMNSKLSAPHINDVEYALFEMFLTKDLQSISLKGIASCVVMR